MDNKAEVEKRLTVEEWLKETKDLGYYIKAYPEPVVIAKGWKAALEMCAWVVAAGIVMSGMGYGMTRMLEVKTCYGPVVPIERVQINGLIYKKEK